MKSIKIKYLLADFPICLFNQEKDEVLIPQWLFDDRKEHLILLTLAPAKEKSFMNQFKRFGTPENVIYRGICSCGADYIGETVCNAHLRWNKHENGTDKNSNVLII